MKYTRIAFSLALITFGTLLEAAFTETKKKGYYKHGPGETIIIKPENVYILKWGNFGESYALDHTLKTGKRTLYACNGLEPINAPEELEKKLNETLDTFLKEKKEEIVLAALTNKEIKSKL